MTRFHIHIAVSDLSESIDFYSTLFGAEPAVRKPDYAKWTLDDPSVNFAISQRVGATGVNHLGFQLDSEEELESAHGQLLAAGRRITTEKGARCCYAVSDKYWVTDPAGVPWEAFHTLGAIDDRGSEELNGCGTLPTICCGLGAEAVSERKKDACCRGAENTNCCR